VDIDTTIYERRPDSDLASKRGVTSVTRTRTGM
jgi:hypothetical protein